MFVEDSWERAQGQSERGSVSIRRACLREAESQDLLRVEATCSSWSALKISDVHRECLRGIAATFESRRSRRKRRRSAGRELRDASMELRRKQLEPLLKQYGLDHPEWGS